MAAQNNPDIQKDFKKTKIEILRLGAATVISGTVLTAFALGIIKVGTPTVNSGISIIFLLTTMWSASYLGETLTSRPSEKAQRPNSDETHPQASRRSVQDTPR